MATISRCKAWAVGSYKARGGSTRTLILYWNGKRWNVQRSPNPGGTERYDFTELSGVAATSATDAWAVGYHRTHHHFKALIEHWNGKAWKIQRSPNPSGYPHLVGVTATSATNAWAVGGTETGHTLVEHWNGTAWKIQPSPNGGDISAVTATSATNAWAVNGGILHWGGTAWKAQRSPNIPNSGLSGVAATSSTTAWAVGSRGYHFDRTLIERWNGKAWQIQKSPNPGGRYGDSDLFGVAATSAKNAWAVGDFFPPNEGFGRTLVERWNGKAWKRQKSRNPGGAHSQDDLSAMAATSVTNAWAVGYILTKRGDKRTLALHWNGAAWGP